MDIEKEYSCLEQNKRVLYKSIEIEENYQESLQAYCDDMYRIVKCTAHSYVTNVDINYNEVKIFGKTEICITYYDENSNLCYADFDEEFTRSVEAESLTDSAFANAKICDKYCSFRVINQRRIDVHSSCVVSLSVYDKQSCPCVSSCNSSKLRYETVKTADVVGSSISKVEFDEELLLSASVKRIISASGYVSVEDKKIIKDKALIKLKACISILYCLDSSNEQIERYEHSFSLSKIIDINNIDENSIAIVNADIGALFFKIKNTSGENSSVVQLYGDVAVNSLFVVESEKKIVTDGYILKHKSKCDYSAYPCMASGMAVNEKKQNSISFEFNSEIKEIYDLSISAFDVVVKNKKIVAKAIAFVVCRNENGDLSSFNTTAEFEIIASSLDSGIFALSTDGFDYSLHSNGRIDVRYSYSVCGYMFSEKNINVLSEILAEDEENKFPALTVYFAKKDEAVWNIAKSFSSDIDLIINENELSADVLDSNQVLIIPSI